MAAKKTTKKMTTKKAMKPAEYRAVVSSVKKVKTDPAFRKISAGLKKEIEGIINDPKLTNMACCVQGCCVSWCCVRVVLD